jgi:hypothetical protein
MKVRASVKKSVETAKSLKGAVSSESFVSTSATNSVRDRRIEKFGTYSWS